jgi:SpoIID/LytB domain protein
VTASLVPSSGGSAGAASTFVFYGSGYGHGIGMSQWGAYGLAKMGWKDSRILRHFYRGATVDRSGDVPTKIRVGLTDSRSRIHLTARGGRVRLWVGEPADGEPIGTIRGRETWTVVPKDRSYLVLDDAGTSVGAQRWGSRAEALVVTYEEDDARVMIQESSNREYARGSVELNHHRCGGPGPCSIRAIVRLRLQHYLYGLGEVPSSWPMQSLRAQAIAGRTYAVFGMRRSGLRASCNCHIGNSASDQVYVGYSKESGTDGDRWVAAVDATDRDVVTYRGDLIQAFYAASDGGHSENVEDIWHGGNPAYAIPWLSGVCDPGESTPANPWTDWSRSFSASSLSSRLAPYTGGVGTIRSFDDVRRGVSGRIVTAVAVGTGGRATVTGGELRAALGLPDGRVWINSNRNITGTIRERYDRLMCEPGLPTSRQRSVPGGAQQFFEDGGLYRNGGRDVTVWLHGLIDAEYRRVDAAAGVLGLPLGGARAVGRAEGACPGCRRVDFARGRIYLKGSLGANALWGDVLSTYLDNGGPGGALGYPRTSVRPRAAGGFKTRFEHGRIVCLPSAGCTVTLS